MLSEFTYPGTARLSVHDRLIWQRLLLSSYWQLRGVIVHWHREDIIHCLQLCGTGSWHT